MNEWLKNYLTNLILNYLKLFLLTGIIFNDNKSFRI